MATTQTFLTHWIQGREESSRSGRRGEVTNSATGEVVSQVPFADAEEVDAAVQAAVAAAPAWESSSLTKRTQIMFAFRELLHEHRDEMARIVTRRARQGHRRRPGRGPARARAGRIRLRTRAAAQGRALMAGLARRRQLHAAPAGRRRRRDHAVQLPLDGPALDVPAGARRRQHVRPQAVRAGPLRVGAAGELLAEAGVPDGRLQRRARRPRGGRRAARPIPA